MPKRIKVAVWNVNSIKSRLNGVVEWIAKNQPDFLLLQELKCEEDKFPYEVFDALNYNFVLSCQKTYNGVAILSKYKIEEVSKRFPGDPDTLQARFIEACVNTEIGYIRLISLYVPNGGEVGSSKFEYKLKFLDKLNEYLISRISLDELFVIGGDYNVAPEDIDVYDANYLQNSTCFTLNERRKIRSLLNLGLEDAYRLTNPNKSEFTWWDYRGNSFHHNKGMRIDHILLSGTAADRLMDCYIDSEVRNMQRSSDHAPIIAEFGL